jgi:2,4-dienoyl-CoA reductase-like NADH-dependent reductase (Old Yellow Enzyme family)
MQLKNTVENTIFEPAVLAGIKMKNRIIRSATHEGMADEHGCPTEQLKKTYLKLAKGEVGAIITGYTGIQHNGKGSFYRMLMIDKDRFVDAYKEVVDAVHEYDTPIILQIAHCGRQTRSKITGENPVAPSAIRDKYFNEDLPKELTERDIDEIIENFVEAIKRAKTAGFDGVQLHAAHGYLLSQFLSPYMNRRQDKWGVTTENRVRIIREIYNRSIAQVGNYPIFIKLNAHDGRKHGMRIEESVKIAKLLEQCGCSGIEVSCGVSEDRFYTTRAKKFPIEAIFTYSFKYKTLASSIKVLIKPFINVMIPPISPLTNYNVRASQAIKSHVSIPVIVVGGITSLFDITDIIKHNKADFVSMCRPFIIEPSIVKKFKEGKQNASKCISCNYCIVAAEERPLRCYYGKLKE